MQSDVAEPTLDGRATIIWLAAHIVGVAVLSMSSLFLLVLLRDSRIGQLWTPSATFVYGLLGCLQGVLLRSFRLRISFWVMTSILGAILAGFADAGVASMIDGTISPLLVPFVRGVAAGTLVGICQWCVLRRHGTWASMWIVAMALTGLLIGLAQLSSILVWCAGIGLIVPGAVIGGVTGVALAGILNQMILDKTKRFTSLP
jgi:hypothetical protein